MAGLNIGAYWTVFRSNRCTCLPNKSVLTSLNISFCEAKHDIPGFQLYRVQLNKQVHGKKEDRTNTTVKTSDIVEFCLICCVLFVH